MKVILFIMDNGDGLDPHTYINWDKFGNDEEEIAFKNKVDEYLEQYHADCKYMRETPGQYRDIKPFTIAYEDIPEGFFDDEKDYILWDFPLKNITEFDELEILEEFH